MPIPGLLCSGFIEASLPWRLEHELALAHLDQVLGLAAGAVDILVEMAGLASERGDDMAGLEASGARLESAMTRRSRPQERAA